jgi:hypothetical protein
MTAPDANVPEQDWGSRLVRPHKLEVRDRLLS